MNTVHKTSKEFTRETSFMPFSYFICRFFSCVKIIPAVWDSNKFSLSPLYFSVRTSLYYITFSFFCFDYLFIVFCVFQFVYCHWPLNRRLNGELIGLASPLGYKTVSLLSHMTLLLRRQEAFAFVNQMFQLGELDEDLRSDFFSTKILFIIFSIRCGQVILVGIVKPDKPQFWYSTLDPRWKTRSIYIFHCLFTVQSSLASFAGLFGAMNGFLYAEVAKKALTKPMSGHESKLDQLVSYRRIQILSRSFNSVYSVLIIPFMKMYIHGMSVCYLFGTVHFYDIIDTRIYIQMPVSFLSVLAFCLAFLSPTTAQPTLSKAYLKQRFQNVTQGHYNVRNVQEDKIYLNSCQQICVSSFRRAYLPKLSRFIIIQISRLLVFTSKTT